MRKSDVERIAKRFDPSVAYDSISIEDAFEEGINNKSLPIDFLARVLHIQEPEANGVLFVESTGYYLYFDEGLLTGCDPADGLNQWAKSLRGLKPAYLARCEQEASHFLGSDIRKITNEVNIRQMP